MQRYRPGAQKYWANFPPRSITIWTGESHFYVSQHFQQSIKEGQIPGFPVYVPTWDSWIEGFRRPAGHAFNPATGLRFTFWITHSPFYAFAVYSAVQGFQTGDTIVRTLAQLEDWQVSLGLDPEDRQSATAGNLVERMISQVFSLLMKNVNLIGYNPEQWRNWKAWGGEYPEERP